MAYTGRGGARSLSPRKDQPSARVEFFDSVGYVGRLFDDRPALVSLDHRLHVRHLVTVAPNICLNGLFSG
jgi:hypothetical protein